MAMQSRQPSVSEAQQSAEAAARQAHLAETASGEPHTIDETDFEDLAAFRLKPEDIEGESPEFLARYTAYLRRHGFRFD